MENEVNGLDDLAFDLDEEIRKLQIYIFINMIVQIIIIVICVAVFISGHLMEPSLYVQRSILLLGLLITIINWYLLSFKLKVKESVRQVIESCKVMTQMFLELQKENDSSIE